MELLHKKKDHSNRLAFLCVYKFIMISHSSLRHKEYLPNYNR